MLPIVIENKRNKKQVEWKKLISTLLDFGINIAVGNPKGTGKLLENLDDAFSTSLSNERLAFLMIFKPIFFALDRTIQELQKQDAEITARLRQINPYFEVEKSISQYLTEEGYQLDRSFFEENFIF